jgi:hypothetical protein
MPIISDPYNDQRNTLTQSIMRQAIPGFLRQLNPNQFRGQSPGFGGGGPNDAPLGWKPQISPEVQQRMAAWSASGAAPPLPSQAQLNSPDVQRINSMNSGTMPGTVPSASSQPPQMNPGLSMPPPQPPQQMMPSSMPPGGISTAGGWAPSQQQIMANSSGQADTFPGAGMGGTSAGSKGASAQPPAPAAMKAGM